MVKQCLAIFVSFDAIQFDYVYRKIPVPVVAIVSDVLGTRYTHAQIDNFMEEAAGIERETPPGGNRQVKTRAWRQHANETCSDPLATLGKVIIELMELGNSSSSWDRWEAQVEDPLRERVNKDPPGPPLGRLGPKKSPRYMVFSRVGPNQSIEWGQMRVSKSLVSVVYQQSA